MNRQLERQLQTTVQGLKATELACVLAHFERIVGQNFQKTSNKKGMNYESELKVEKHRSRGYGRTDEEALCNATKNIFSKLIGQNFWVEQIKQSLKYRQEGAEENLQQKLTGLGIDDISVIQPQNDEYQEEDSYAKIQQSCEKPSNNRCDCIFYEMQKYHQNQVKHLQARVNLLTEENMMLKKVLLQGANKGTPAKGDQSSILFGSQAKDKENISLQGNLS